ncbi:hypothetical protein DXG03_006511 [Asterophora parasitica]|uniref:Protein LCHN n=1 Tax=Asterophora parasitica TaxID=117018 RepID=A0A9P7GDQ7_9AGAR|nr:hypothetical protein DXG03_006511 [Asterophora parasitica]
MTAAEDEGKFPQDLVAIFHASFHPTQGNLIDWYLKASENLNLDNLEFSALPSGLHLVEQDVVYFTTKDDHHGVCVFRRRKTVEHGHRGFRLSSLGILTAKSRRPRPWRHTSALKDLITRVYTECEETGWLHPAGAQWEPARVFFEERKVQRANLHGLVDWYGWSHELSKIETDLPSTNPTLHLPHLLRILGPSSLTLYKHVLGRRRILIFTLPPVEAACILCEVAANMCFEAQLDTSTDGEATSHPHSGRLKGKCKEPINVLGMVTLSDMDRLHSEGLTGRGWIACTTDAIFLDKPSCYDLLIDLTTSTPNKATRPSFYASKAIPPQPGNSPNPTHRLSTIRFAWSDVKLWNELDRILSLDASHSSHHGCCGPCSTSMSPTDVALKEKFITTWTDAWRVYEDVCVICAGLWMGSWRGNSAASYSTAAGAENWGKVRLEGDDDLSISGVAAGEAGGVPGGGYVRNVGMGIEGRPVASGSKLSQKLGAGSAPSTPTAHAMRRSSGMSWSSGRATVVGSFGQGGKARQVSSSIVESSEDGHASGHGSSEYDGDGTAEERRDRHLLTTLSLLQTFHGHTVFQLSVLESFIPKDGGPGTTVYLAPKDIVAFELGPMSTLDARYLEWLAQEYAGDTKVVIKRGWKDLLGALFGYS